MLARNLSLISAKNEDISRPQAQKEGYDQTLAGVESVRITVLLDRVLVV